MIMAMPEYCLEQNHEILLLFPNDLYNVCPSTATTTTLTGGHYEAPVPVSVVRMRGPMMEIVPRFATTLPSKLGVVQFSGFRSAE